MVTEIEVANANPLCAIEPMNIKFNTIFSPTATKPFIIGVLVSFNE